MKVPSVSCSAALAALVLTTQAVAGQPDLKVGTLRCDVAGGLGLIITSSKEMSCVFTSDTGSPERYSGTIRKFGLDIGATDKGVLSWAVFAPAQGFESGALAGEYAGAGASATVIAGLGANALVGGFGRSLALQPLSAEAQTGLALAAGVTSMTLRFVP